MSKDGKPGLLPLLGNLGKALSVRYVHTFAGLLLLCCLFPEKGFAISGPANSTTGQFTLTLTPPPTGGLAQYFGQSIKAYRNGSWVATYSPALSHSSYNVTVAENGVWRFEHYIQFRYCVFRSRRLGCMEWDYGDTRSGEHSVSVTILAQPGAPSSISAPALNDGSYTLSWGLQAAQYPVINCTGEQVPGAGRLFTVEQGAVFPFPTWPRAATAIGCGPVTVPMAGLCVPVGAHRALRFRHAPVRRPA